jgi:AcrR family transcriptional regulator
MEKQVTEAIDRVQPPAEQPAGQSTERPLRADAQRNRALLLTAARSIFAERGTDASLEEIAKRAGVGIGTLYRHFPTRGDLITWVYSSEVENLCAEADLLLATVPPDVALQQWLECIIDYAEVKRGLAAALKPLLGEDSDGVFQRARQMFHASMAKLVTAAVEAGTIRADADPEDLLRGVGGICGLDEADGWQDRARRLLGILMDGLRAGAPAKG